MDINIRREELSGLLTTLPPAEFCCVYGSTLHPNNYDKSRMVDYILGVRNPVQWHSENLKMNRDHYASLVPYLGGARLSVKYGVVGMHNLVQDIVHWEKFYLSGRLQKPVYILVDRLNLQDINTSNLRAATSAALLLLPFRFREEDLYAKICSLSYMGDIRMLFAEDKNKVKKIVQGQFDLFKTMYKPIMEEFETRDLLRKSTVEGQQKITQDCNLSSVQSFVSFLPSTVKNQMGIKLGCQKKMQAGGASYEVDIGSKEEVVRFMAKILRRRVMASSARQTVSGFLISGGAKASRYLANKVTKAWKSWT